MPRLSSHSKKFPHLLKSKVDDGGKLKGPTLGPCISETGPE